MTELSDVERFIREHLAPKFSAAGVDTPDGSLSLSDAGVIDSIGFLDLISAVEAHFQLEIDLEEVDIDDFMTLGGFVRHVEQLVAGAPEPPTA